MAELLYNEEGRLLFTEEMKKEYTLLMPQMLPVHFTMLKKVFEMEGYQVDMLTTNHRGIVDEGLKYVHNDTCYPALLVIGQLLDAVKSGKYDPHKLGLLITQTGGGCQPVGAGEKPGLFPGAGHDPAHGLFHDLRGLNRAHGQPVPPL